VEELAALHVGCGAAFLLLTVFSCRLRRRQGGFSRLILFLNCEGHPLASELEQFYLHFRIVTHTRQPDAFARRVMKDAIEAGTVVHAGTHHVEGYV